MGNRTLSTTWITPFDWITSTIVTAAVPPDSTITITAPPEDVTLIVPPDTVLRAPPDLPLRVRPPEGG